MKTAQEEPGASIPSLLADACRQTAVSSMYRPSWSYLVQPVEPLLDLAVADHLVHLEVGQ